MTTVPNIIYLHGFASGPRSSKGRFFHKQFAMIGADLHQLDLVPGDFKDITISGQLEIVGKAVDELKPSLLIGSSLGGYLAALYAAREPEKTPPLVLIAPAFDFARRWAERLGSDMDEWKRSGELGVYHYGLERIEPVVPNLRHAKPGSSPDYKAMGRCHAGDVHRR